MRFIDKFNVLNFAKRFNFSNGVVRTSTRELLVQSQTFEVVATMQDVPQLFYPEILRHLRGLRVQAKVELFYHGRAGQFALKYNPGLLKTSA